MPDKYTSENLNGTPIGLINKTNMQDFILPGSPIDNANLPNQFGNDGKVELTASVYISDNDVFTYASDKGITESYDDLLSIISYHDRFLLPKYQVKANYYKGRHNSIIKRSDVPEGRPDSRLIINFPKKLVDTFNGFCNFGSTQISDKSGNDAINEYIKQWINTSDFEDYISELSKQSSIYGRSYLYLFENASDISMAVCSPQDTIVVYDDTVQHNPMFAIRYSTNSNGNYTGTIIKNDGNYSFGSSNNVGSNGETIEKAVSFEYPCLSVIELRDNEERIGIFDDVISLIDAVNQTNSNKNNDTDSYKNNYLAVTGAKMDKDQIRDMNFSNFINLYPKENNSFAYSQNNGAVRPSVDFISPNPNDVMQENTLNRNIDLIYQISQVVDMNDSKIGTNMSNISGTALMQRYQTMEAKARVKANKLKTVFRQLFSILFTVSKQKEDVSNLEYAFNLAIPHNTVEETQSFGNVYGKIPNDQALKLLSFITDNAAVAQAMDKNSQSAQQQVNNLTKNAVSNNLGSDKNDPS